MATVTPARIIYNDSNGTPRVLRFHAVISEAHEASTEITTFPVQTGFVVSNHAIKKNRKVNIEAIITNTVLANSQNDFVYSNNNSRSVFDIIQFLVNSAVVCEVLTNLGNYKPVVFDRFSTKQMAGMVDSMKIQLSGQELQVKDATNLTAPKVLSFTTVPKEEYQSTLASLKKQGYPVEDGMILSTAKLNVGSDHVISSPNTKGINKKVTNICKGYDPVKQTYKYEQHIEVDELENVTTTTFNPFSLADKVGSALSSCLTGGVVDLVADEAGELVQTSIGKLRKSAYGFKNKLVKMGGGKVGQALTGMAVDCVVVGAEAGFDEAASQLAPGSALDKVQGLPETQDIVDGIQRMGIATKSIPLKSVTFTKISGFGKELVGLNL